MSRLAMCLLMVAVAVTGCGKSESKPSAGRMQDDADSKVNVATKPKRTGTNREGRITRERVGKVDTRLDYRVKAAVIIGIDRYTGAGWKQNGLNCAVNDARAIAERLVDEYGYQEEHIALLTNEEATLSAIQEKFNGWLPALGLSDRDSLIVFFAGHGKSGYLIASDSDGTNLADTAVSMDWLKRTLQDTTYHKLVILDSCYSGSLFRQPEAPASTPARRAESGLPGDVANARGEGWGEDTIAASLAAPCFMGLSAGRDTVVVDEEGDSGHSLFTTALLRSMENRALMNADEQVFLGRMLLGDVERRVIEKRVSKQRPFWGYLGPSSGDFLFRPTFLRDIPAVRMKRQGNIIAQAKLARSLREAKRQHDAGRSEIAKKIIKQLGEEPNNQMRLEYRLLADVVHGARESAIRVLAYENDRKGGARIDQLRFSADGQQVGFHFRDWSTYIKGKQSAWSVTTGEEIKKPDLPPNFRVDRWNMDVRGKSGRSKVRVLHSPDRRIELREHGRSIVAVDLESGDELYEIDLLQIDLEFSRDSRFWFAINAESGEMRRFETLSGKSVIVPERLVRWREARRWSNYALSADGRLVAIVRDRALRIWDVDTGQLLSTTDLISPNWPRLSFSSDGTILVVNAKSVELNKKKSGLTPTDPYSSSGAALFINVLSGEEVYEFADLRGRPLEFCFDPTDSRLAVLYHSGDLEIWDPHGEVPSEDNRLRITPKWEMNLPGDFVGLTNRRIGVHSGDRVVVTQFGTERKFEIPLTDDVTSIAAFSPSGTSVAARLKDPKQLAVVGRESSTILESRAEWGPVDFYHNEKNIVSGESQFGGHQLVIWDVEERKPIVTMRRHKHPIVAISAAQNRPLLLSLDAAGTVVRWKISRREEKIPRWHTLQEELYEEVAPSSTQVFQGDIENIYVLNGRNVQFLGKRDPLFVTNQGIGVCKSVSMQTYPDPKFAVSVHEQGIALWNVVELPIKEPILFVPENTASVIYATILHNVLVTVEEGCHIKGWDLYDVIRSAKQSSATFQ